MQPAARAPRPRETVLHGLAKQLIAGGGALDLPEVAAEHGSRRRIARKRSLEVHLPARSLDVLGRLGAEGFELTLLSTIMMTRRAATSGGLRS